MKVDLKILLPGLPEVIGGSDLKLVFDGDTVNDVIEILISRYGQAAKNALFDKHGELDPMIQILLNGEEWILHDQLDTNIQDGDNLMLAVMMAGG